MTEKLNITVEELAEFIRERMEEDFTFDKNVILGRVRLDQEAKAQARRMLAAEKMYKALGLFLKAADRTETEEWSLDIDLELGDAQQAARAALALADGAVWFREKLAAQAAAGRELAGAVVQMHKYAQWNDMGTLTHLVALARKVLGTEGGADGHQADKRTD